MKYFLDTEFHEYKATSIFNKPIDTIDLISIGIVSEDKCSITMNQCDKEWSDCNNCSRYSNREYYAICKDFDLRAAWKNEWLRENVLLSIYTECIHGDMRNTFQFNYSSMKWILKTYGKTRKQIANEIVIFIYGDSSNLDGLSPLQESQKYKPNSNISLPEFYAYYADYDWVVFCWLFGRMIDLPKGFPMYCRDLKQTLDNYISKTWKDVEMSTWGHEGISLDALKQHPNYPKQTNEHNALADAKWNKELYEFLKRL